MKHVIGAAKKAGQAVQQAIDEAQSAERPADFGPSCVRNGPLGFNGDAPISISVLVGTWNVGAQRLPERDNIVEWLLGLGNGRGMAKAGDVGPDVIALGIQELVGLHPGHCVMKAGGCWESEDAFSERVLRDLREHAGPYVKVRSVGMIGLYLVVFVKEHLECYVHDVDADRVRAMTEGALAGKKGAVCASFSLNGLPLCFTNVHLPSGQERVEERSTTLRQMRMEAFQGTNMHGQPRPAKMGYKRESRHSVAEGHSGAFVFGDFNFRLSIDAAELPRRISSYTLADSKSLKEFDPSLNGKVDDALDGFSEGRVHFPPTYKFVTGTDTFDEKRLPAWTDRIFYCGHSCELLDYGAHHRLRQTSDHRPVSAKFRVSHMNGLKHPEAPLPPPEQPPDDDNDDGLHLSFRETVEAPLPPPEQPSQHEDAQHPSSREPAEADAAALGATAGSEKPSDKA